MSRLSGFRNRYQVKLHATARTTRTCALCGALAAALSLCGPFTPQALGHPFTDTGANLTAVKDCAVAWGDYDNDGDLDLAISGAETFGLSSKIYRNDGGGVFTPAVWLLTDVELCAMAWGDYNNDGRLDLVVSGRSSSGYPSTRIYRNDGDGQFIQLDAGLTPVAESALAWGDYDNDGDLDLALSGYYYDYDNQTEHYVSQVYRNSGDGSFSLLDAGLTGVAGGALAWGDYDNDGYLDLAVGGRAWFTPVSKIYRNDGNGTFTDIEADLIGAGSDGSLAWADYDNDGDLDLAIEGWGDLPSTRIYRNDGSGIFTDIQASLLGMGISKCSLAWGDYDNDGRIDLLIAGYGHDGQGWEFITALYHNDGADAFTQVTTPVPGVGDCAVAWGDFDNDGDLDLSIAGDSGTGPMSAIYRNDGTVFNTAPAAPSGLSASLSGVDATLSWDFPSDAQTHAAGLSYNLRMGTSPGGQEIVVSMADPASGFRRLPATGNAQKQLSWTLRALPPGTYYWSVQAIDAGFAASAWAAEANLVIPFSPADLDKDGDVGQVDFEEFQACSTGPMIPYTAVPPPGCRLSPDAGSMLAADFDRDGDVDGDDFGFFQRCYSGEDKLADPACQQIPQRSCESGVSPAGTRREYAFPDRTRTIGYTLSNYSASSRVFTIGETYVNGIPTDYAWLSLGNSTRTIGPQTEGSVAMTMTTAGMTPGPHTAYIGFTDDCQPRTRLVRGIVLTVVPPRAPGPCPFPFADYDMDGDVDDKDYQAFSACETGDGDPLHLFDQANCPCFDRDWDGDIDDVDEAGDDVHNEFDPDVRFAIRRRDQGIESEG